MDWTPDKAKCRAGQGGFRGYRVLAGERELASGDFAAGWALSTRLRQAPGPRSATTIISGPRRPKSTPESSRSACGPSTHRVSAACTGWMTVPARRTICPSACRRRRRPRTCARPRTKRSTIRWSPTCRPSGPWQRGRGGCRPNGAFSHSRAAVQRKRRPAAIGSPGAATSPTASAAGTIRRRSSRSRAAEIPRMLIDWLAPPGIRPA
jgi:hypothetical protein